MNDEGRPEPDALLAEATKEGRGRLKVFLGAAPGVGKTFAMLEAAARRKAAGTDVVVGVVETHGRAETEALLAGLDVLPRRNTYYRGRLLPEMDVDAIEARRPDLVLVDELAHTNVPESRHVKRWQDVDDILAAGIDVYTTLNIQHLESLNDVVARVSGVRVRETVPDKVLELADEIELVDLPPEELIERLRQGKVYVQDQVARAIQNFFSKGNLTALRELAMRVAADRVDAQMTAHMKSHAIAGPWPTLERVMVCVNESPVAKSLVRTAKRAADRARVPWIVAHVMTPGREALTEAERDRIAETLKLAESLGAEVVTLNAEADVAREILAFARSRNVSRIVLGRPRPRRFLARFTRETVAERLIAQAADFEVTMVSPDAEDARRAAIRGATPQVERDWRPYAGAIAVVALTTVLTYLIDTIFPVTSLSLVFLVGVLIVATRHGLWPSLVACVLSFFVYNFFFTEPYHTFNVTSEEEILTLLLFLIVAVFTGNLAARVRQQAVAQRAVARRLANLYEFSRKIASAASFDDVVWAAVHHVASTLRCRSLILVPEADGAHLVIAGGYPPEDQLAVKDWGAAEWAWEHGETAGWRSETLPTSSWLFLPLATKQAKRGLLGVSFEKSDGLSPDEARLLDALVDQVAIAIERTRLVSDLEETRVLSETERLRSALLSSVSHDLRTPLVAIIGSATTLLQTEGAPAAAGRRDLIETIREEGERLNRYVQNLLDMTRLGYGALNLKTDWFDLREALGRALRRLTRELGARTVTVNVPEDLPTLRADPVLIEQVLVNVLENAAKYADDGTGIAIAAAEARGRITLTVDDEGPGIPVGERDRIFDMFYRLQSGDGKKAGTGLGLAICRGIVEAHGGTIRALPVLADGRGTRIEIVLPVGADAMSGEAGRGA